MSNQSVLRITKEIASIQKGSDLSLAVACKEDDVRRVHAMIIGPPDTPYEFGFFEFSVHFHKDYPTTAPHVKAITTNMGQTRFNPNIYADGKVCLSILGTWRGESGEQWSSAQGLESVLISIQSLMSANPYENEPGFENPRGEGDKKDAKVYVSKIRHETLRLAVIEPLERILSVDGSPRADDNPNSYTFDSDPDFESFRPFDDLCKRRFLWYYNTYIYSIEEEQKKVETKDTNKFSTMPFENRANQMQGTYNYSELKKRLGQIRKVLDEETDRWEAEGKTAVKGENPVAFAFQNRFKHVTANYAKQEAPVDFELIDQNPFAWRLTLFGRPMSNLEGGVFNIKIVIPLNFPQAHPRVKVETPLYHQRVSPEGVLCYFAQKADDFESHVAGIIEAIEEEKPPYDPRTVVHREAAKLLWGTPDEKKQYNRKLRRSAQDSTES